MSSHELVLFTSQENVYWIQDDYEGEKCSFTTECSWQSYSVEAIRLTQYTLNYKRYTKSYFEFLVSFKVWWKKLTEIQPGQLTYAPSNSDIETKQTSQWIHRYTQSHVPIKFPSLFQYSFYNVLCGSFFETISTSLHLFPLSDGNGIVTQRLRLCKRKPPWE